MFDELNNQLIDIKNKIIREQCCQDIVNTYSVSKIYVKIAKVRRKINNILIVYIVIIYYKRY